MLDYNHVYYFYLKQLWSKSQVADAVKMGVITATQYEQITGDPYTA